MRVERIKDGIEYSIGRMYSDILFKGEICKGFVTAYISKFNADFKQIVIDFYIETTLYKEKVKTLTLNINEIDKAKIECVILSVKL